MSGDEHARFLVRIRRRWCAWRVLEATAICVAIAAAVGVLLLPLVWWGRFDALGIALSLLGIGAITGIVVGLLRLPTLMQTAMEVDRQFNLHDLFGTAISSPAFVDPQFQDLVTAQAAQIARTRSASELILRRLGGRAWGGVGLSSALLLTLAMLVSQPASTQALPERTPPGNSSLVAFDPAQPPGDGAVAAADRMSPPRRDRDAAGASEGPSDNARSDAAGSGNTSRTMAGDSAGGSAGRTESARVDPLRISPSAAASGEGSIASAGGVGSTTSREGPGVGSLSTGAGGTRIPPWQSPTWNADRQAALREIDAGHIPDAYRDLVREYFSRESDR